MYDTVIKVENLSKKYNISHQSKERYIALRDVIANKVKSFSRNIISPFGNTDLHPTKEEFWALKDISFEAKQGEVIGIIGRNGAGKTTLLKILSRITEPTTGLFTIKGHVASLLEVGTGFHPELTGRENIFLNGAILGMHKAEIKSKFDEIVAFAEIEKFLDTPVKRYSSGMYVRLAFSVAAHLEPEILLVDEVLAVGDAAFQKKCLGKMGGFAKAGRTVLFVTHNMYSAIELCKRGIWIDEGIIRSDKDVKQIVSEYLRSSYTHHQNGYISDDMHVNATGDLYFRRVILLNSNNQTTNYVKFGETLNLVMDIEVCQPLTSIRFIVAIKKIDGTLIAVLHHTDNNNSKLIDLQPGNYTVKMDLSLPLMPDRYLIEVIAKPAPGYYDKGISLDWIPHAFDFSVERDSMDEYKLFPTKAILRPVADWQIKPKSSLSS